MVVAFFYRRKPCSLEDMPVLVDVPAISSGERDALLHGMMLMSKEKSKLINVSRSGYMSGKEASAHIDDYIKDLLSPAFIESLSIAAGAHLTPSPFEDPIFLKAYTDERDGMQWHYDQKLSIGRRYTLVIPLIEDPCNTSYLEVMDCATWQPRRVNIPTNKGVLYAGDKILHRVTDQTKNCTRVSLIMILYDDVRQSLWNVICLRARNIVKRFANI